jgi:hypothetical protein
MAGIGLYETIKKDVCINAACNGHSARVKNSFYNIEEGTKKTI